MFFFLFSLLSLPVQAASVLDGYNPDANGAIYASAVQADGKLLVGGAFTTIGGQAKSHIVRLNTDGTVDTTFSADTNGIVYAIIVQPDGKILVGGDFTTIGGQTRNRIARLNPNDSVVELNFAPVVNHAVRALALQLNGDIVIGGDFTTINGEERNYIARLSAGNGSLDPVYTPNANGAVYSLATQRNGKVIAGGNFTIIGGRDRENIARLNELDGSVEMIGDPQVIAFNISANGAVRSVVIQTDGKILIGGDFTILTDSNGSNARNRIALLDADGDTDFNFNPNANGTVRSIILQPDGEVLVGGDFTAIGGQPRNHIARLGIEFGFADNSFAPSVNAPVHTISVQPDEKIVIGGTFTSLTDATTHNRNNLARLHPDGSVEADFIPNIQATNTNDYATISSVAVQADGKILAGGTFTEIGGEERNNLARLNLNGTIDTAFTADTNGAVSSIVVQADGRILVGGNFTTIGGLAIPYLARLNPDGSVDTSFTPYPNSAVHTMAVQSNGNIMVGGRFTTIGGMTRKNLARVYGNTGAGDTSYTTATDGPVYSLVVQSDGKLVIGGDFTKIGGATPVTRTYIARVAEDGVVDSTTLFKNTGANKAVRTLALQADGTILVGGDFTTIDGTTARNYIARLKVDGDIDPTFIVNADAIVRSIVVQADSDILVGGDFTAIGGEPQNFLARVSGAGVVDAEFIANANAAVHSVAVQANDNSILTGGAFTAMNSAPRNHIARIATTGAVDANFAPNASSISQVLISAIAAQGDGKLLIGGLFSHIDGTPSNHIARLHPNGSLDTTWSTHANGEITSIVFLSNDKILLCGNFTSITDANGTFSRNSLARLNANGTVDGTFNPMIHGKVYAMAEETALTTKINGDLLIAGDFTSITMTNPDTGVITKYARPFIARFDNVDLPETPALSVDTTFNSVATNNPNRIVRAIATQTDGKILVGGDFTWIGNQSRSRMARLIKTSGLHDSTFDPNSNGTVRTIVVQPDGDILAGGDFTYIGNQTRNGIARLNKDSAKADEFNPNANDTVHAIAIQTDGMILAIGKFTRIGDIGGVDRNHVARLTPTLGVADTFNPAIDLASTVASIVVQTDGKIVVGGDFTTIDSQARNQMARLSADSAALQDLHLSVDGQTITWNRNQSSPELHDVVFYESANNTVWTKIPAATTRTTDGWKLDVPDGALFQRQNRYIAASAKTSGGFYNGSTSSLQTVNQYFLDYFTLTVTPKPTTGWVESNLVGIGCGFNFYDDLNVFHDGSDCSEAYQADTSLTLTANPVEYGYKHGDGYTDYIFTQWGGVGNGCGTGTNNSVSVLMDSNKTCTANFAKAYTSLLVKAGSGSGTVDWDPENRIDDLAPEGGKVYENGKTAKVTAVANADSIFSGWTGNCTGTTSPFDLVMNGDKTCTATFKIARTLTLTTSGAGDGTVGGSGRYADGTTASASATATPGSKFTGWSGSCSGTISPVNVTMNADKTCNANFEIAWTMTVNKSGSGDGTVSGAGQYLNGVVAAVTAAPNSTSLFTGWSGDCSGTTSPLSVTMISDKTCTANFEPKRTLTVSKNGTGTGTVTGAGPYPQGATALPTATPDSSSIFAGWSGACTGTDSPYSLVMDANKTCTATFNKGRTLTITKTGDGNGTVSGSGGYTLGTTAIVTAEASPGSSFAGWSGDCSGSTSPLNVVMDANKTCTASFRLPTLTVFLTGNGTGAVISEDSNINCPAGDCSHIYDLNDSVTLTATPNGDFIFQGWSGPGINCPGTEPCTITMDSYKDVSARFQSEFPWNLFLPTIINQQR